MGGAVAVPLGAGLSLRWADSELAGLQPWTAPDGRPGLVLRWAAATLVRPAPGGAGLRLLGHVRGLRLRLWPHDAAATAALPLGALRDGELRWQGRCLRELPLPCRLEGALSLQLSGHQGEVWSWQGCGLSAELDPGLPFFESLAC